MIEFTICDGGRSLYRPSERKDCTVRALSAAADVSYKHAHRYMSAYGRREGCGVNCRPAYDALVGCMRVVILRGRYANGYRCIYPYLPMGCIIRQKHYPTLDAFVREHPTGRYLLTVRGHALAVVDGVVIDAQRIGGRTRVRAVWRLRETGEHVLTNVPK